MLEGNNSSKKYYIPKCRENGCDGVLNLIINDNYTIECECENNNSHKNSNIYFQTFERFYLKEQETKTCFNCSSKLDNASYNCINCDKSYCTLCFVNDEHIKANINNLKIDTNKCPLHNGDLTQYCTDCKKYYCLYCLISDENKINLIYHNEKHHIVNLMNLIPTKNKINDLKRKLIQKSFFYDKIIKIINEWENHIKSEANRLKQKLRDEINILEKIIFHYNQYYINYSYLSIFKYIDDTIFTNKAYSLLNDLFYSFDFKKKTKILLKLFNGKSNKEKNIPKKIKANLFYGIKKGGIIEKINNTSYFEAGTGLLYLNKFNKEEDDYTYIEKFCPEFKEEIYSVSVSQIKRQIYACLLNKKTVKIFDYDFETQEIKINEYEITGINYNNSSDHFNKCIYIGNENYATADYNYVIIWEQQKEGKFFILNTINIGAKTSDLLSPCDKYFISNQPYDNTITIFNLNSSTQKKNVISNIINTIIPGIDSIDSNNSLLKLDKYIIINCNNGIALFYINTKEIVQYIKNNKRITQNKKIFIDINENVCILNKNNSKNNSYTLEKFKMKDGSLEPFESYEEINIDEKGTKIISLYKKILLLCENNIYSLTEENG